MNDPSSLLGDHRHARLRLAGSVASDNGGQTALRISEMSDKTSETRSI
jgi:hypothetical protein